jgi:uncharacterized tellurite resistance protein B-like protein
MLKQIRALFAAADMPDGKDHEAALHLAAAVLLIEVAKADHSLEGLELERLGEVLRREWNVDEGDLADLLDVAKSTSDDSVSLHEHVDLINRHYSVEQKLALVRGLWQVACADDVIHHHEEALIRRLADLIHVSHAEFIRAKHLANEQR